MGERKPARLSSKDRRVIEAMIGGGGIFIYLDDEGGTEGAARYPDWPKPGSGAIVFDGPPVPVTRRLVSRLHRIGTEWDGRAKALVLSAEGRAKARIILAGRDVLLLASHRASPPLAVPASDEKSAERVRRTDRSLLSA